MDENKNYIPKYRRDDDSWEENSWQTGSTNPPKSRGGLVAVLLVLVIFLSGIVTVLGILNVKLFQELNQKEQEEELAISFTLEETAGTLPTSVPQETEPAQEAVPPQTVPGPGAQEQLSMELTPSPSSADNAPQSEGLPLQEIYQKNIDSVVSISCTLHSGSSSGTGVVLSRDGYIVTNAHVVEGAQSITAQFTDDRVLPARIIGSDEVSDLAVLHVEAEDLSPATFGESDNLRVGDTVVAIGDPLGVELRGTLTDGIVSAINRDVMVDGRPMTLIQTNAALNSGNSGGPLINCYGQVIGINTMKVGDFADTAGVEGLGFAIPSSTVKDVVDQLISQGYVSGRPTLGLEGESLSVFYQHYYRLPEGLYITGVEEGSDAAQKGIERGDILMKINGTSITTAQELSSVLYNCQVGDVVTVIIYRGGYQYELQLTVSEDKG